VKARSPFGLAERRSSTGRLVALAEQCDDLHHRADDGDGGDREVARQSEAVVDSVHLELPRRRAPAEDVEERTDGKPPDQVFH
jgi:hypothetical protein